MKPDYIVSDVHLGAVPKETELELVRFLDHVGEEGASLLIGGDLFDFWFEYGEVVPGRHFRTLAAIARLVDGGIPVTMAGGNHDAWGGRFLREEVGMAFHTEPFEYRLGGRKTLVAHGDGLGRGDFKYRALKAVIRGRVAVTGFRVLPAELGMRIARGFSRTHAKSDEDLAAAGRSRFLLGWGTEQLTADPSLSYVVCGHSHVPLLHEHEPGRYYINSGDWVQSYTYVVVSADGPEMRRWGGDGVLA